MPQIPPNSQLSNLLLRVLRESGGVASVRHQLEFVIRYTNFVGDVQKLRHRLAWVRTTLKALGLIRIAEPGIWQLTELGYLALDLEAMQGRFATRTFTRQPPIKHFLSPDRVRSSADRIELLLYLETATDAHLEVQPLTADYLKDAVVPLIAALDGIQQLVSFEWNLQFPPLVLIALSRTDVKISLEGSGEILDGVLKHVIPSQRKHFKLLQELKIAEQESKIEKLRAEQKEIEARQAESEARRKEREAAAAERRARAKSIDMDCQLKQAQLAGEQWRLLRDIVNDIKPNATEEEKIALARRLLSPIKTLTESELTPKVIKITEGEITKHIVSKTSEE